MSDDIASVYESAEKMPADPGPPVIVTNVPFASTAARWMAKVTCHTAGSSEK